MNELEIAELALKQKHVTLNMCSALNHALSIDKTELNIQKLDPSWSQAQREKLLAKYYDLLLSL